MPALRAGMKVSFAALGVEHRRFERPDLPEEVQVGLIAYTDWDSAQHLQNDPFRFNTTVTKGGRPDLVTLVDYVRFE